MRLILIAQLFSTLYMVGLIWFVQIIHYPLFTLVGRDRFPEFEKAHRRLTTRVVAPCMLLELLTAVGLAAMVPANQQLLVWAGLVLLALIWGSTWCLQVPVHAALARQFSVKVHRQLVISNWIRTIAWSGRALIVLLLSLQLLGD